MSTFTQSEWDEFQAWKASQSKPHVSFVAQGDDEDYSYDDETLGFSGQGYSAPAPTYNIPPTRRVKRPKPSFNGSTFTLPEGGTKSQRKIFQTSILKEAYKLVQDDPRLKGKAGGKLRLKICNAAMKEFKSVYEDPNFLFFIQDPASCQSIIQDFAAELEAQLENA